MKQFQVVLSPAKMKAHGISLSQGIRALAEGNENVSAGFINSFSTEWLIAGVGRVRSLEDIGKTVVQATNSIPTLVADLGEVIIGEEPKRGEGSMRGRPAVILGIQKQPGRNPPRAPRLGHRPIGLPGIPARHNAGLGDIEIRVKYAVDQWNPARIVVCSPHQLSSIASRADSVYIYRPRSPATGLGKEMIDAEHGLD